MNKIKFALHPDISTKARNAVGRHERAVYEMHGDRYDYSKVIFKSINVHVIIGCGIHGDFAQRIADHKKGSGCERCSYIERGENSRMRQAEFIQQANRIHENYYDYSMVHYVNTKTPVDIVCPKHGVFSQVPNAHTIGNCGCPKCGNEAVSHALSYTTDEFIQSAKSVHGDRYGYSKVDYSGNDQKIVILCSVHGEFLQMPSNHLRGAGCSKCNGGVSGMLISPDDFITRAMEVHGQYRYITSSYSGMTNPVSIICDVHGEFSQVAYSHLEGRGCKKCSFDERKISKQEFISTATHYHNGVYDYGLVDYIDYETKVVITCPIHGQFSQTPHKHATANGCPKCSQTGPSKGETAIGDRIVELLGGDESLVVRNSRKIISPLELDIYIPSAKLAIEYCGAYWHSDKMIMAKFSKGKYADLSLSARRKLARNYHYNKFKQCEDQGIRLITLFEDEWINSPDIVMSVINHGLGLSERGTGARKLAIKATDAKVAKEFLNKNHPQGSVSCTTYLGGYDGDQLVGVMGFGNPTRPNSQGVELKRFVTSGKSYAGLAGRLFAHYVRNYDPIRIISFSDNRWFSGGMYKRLGFRIETNLPPDYSYIHLSDYRRVHKSTYRRAGIKRHFPEQYSEELTEREMMALVGGIERNFDCGKRRWGWGLSKDEYAIAVGPQ